jgi:hypothetical protein
MNSVNIICLVVASILALVLLTPLLQVSNRPTEIFGNGGNISKDVRVQFTFTDSININHREQYFKYNPREMLARNFAATFDERVRYIRVCDTGACDPLTSYVVDLSRINQRLPKGTIRKDRVYRLEEKTEDFTISSDDFFDAIGIRIVVHTYVPINTELMYHDIAELVKNGLVEVFIQKSLQVKNNYMLQLCISATVHHQNTCERIEWSDDVNVPDVESTDPHMMIQFIPRQV